MNDTICAHSQLKRSCELCRFEEEFICEGCDHNVYHPRLERLDECDIDPQFGEFCTFLMCGRCWNELARQKLCLMEALRGFGIDGIDPATMTTDQIMDVIDDWVAKQEIL